MSKLLNFRTGAHVSSTRLAQSNPMALCRPLHPTSCSVAIIFGTYRLGHYVIATQTRVSSVVVNSSAPTSQLLIRVDLSYLEHSTVYYFNGRDESFVHMHDFNHVQRKCREPSQSNSLILPKQYNKLFNMDLLSSNLVRTPVTQWRICVWIQYW